MQVRSIFSLAEIISHDRARWYMAGNFLESSAIKSCYTACMRSARRQISVEWIRFEGRSSCLSGILQVCPVLLSHPVPVFTANPPEHAPAAAYCSLLTEEIFQCWPVVLGKRVNRITHICLLCENLTAFSRFNILIISLT